MTQEIETIRRPRGPVGTNRWTMNADDMLPGQGRRSFLIPNYIRDVSMKVTRRTILHDRGKRDGFSVSLGFLSSSNNRGT